MKKYQIINFHHFLSQIDLQKVDKEARAQLIRMDIVLGDIVDEHNAEVEKVKARLSRGHEAEIQEVGRLYEMLQMAEDKKEIMAQIESHTSYAELQAAMDEEVNSRLMEDVEVDVEKVESEDLAGWFADSGLSITLEMLREWRKAGLTL